MNLSNHCRISIFEEELKFQYVRGDVHIHKVPHPDVFWYHLNGMGTQKIAPKKVLARHFPYIFHLKTKWNIVYKYLKTKTFPKDKYILPQMHWTSNTFGPSTTTIGGLLVSQHYPILNFKKMVFPKPTGCCTAILPHKTKSFHANLTKHGEFHLGIISDLIKFSPFVCIIEKSKSWKFQLFWERGSWEITFRNFDLFQLWGDFSAWGHF